MPATTHPPRDDDDMPAEIDFSGAARGKFYHSNLKLNLPVYLDADVQACLATYQTCHSGEGRNPVR